MIDIALLAEEARSKVGDIAVKIHALAPNQRIQALAHLEASLVKMFVEHCPHSEPTECTMTAHQLVDEVCTRVHDIDAAAMSDEVW